MHLLGVNENGYLQSSQYLDELRNSVKNLDIVRAACWPDDFKQSYFFLLCESHSTKLGAIDEKKD